MVIAGNRVYQRCADCGKLVRMTGIFAGIHLCLTDEEKRELDRFRDAVRKQHALPSTLRGLRS